MSVAFAKLNAFALLPTPVNIASCFDRVTTIRGRELATEDPTSGTTCDIARINPTRAQQQFLRDPYAKRIADVSQMNVFFGGGQPTATTSRLVHSVQAMLMGRELLTHLFQHSAIKPLSHNHSQPNRALSPDENKMIKTIEWIMLLHDIAHPPFAHGGENALHKFGQYLYNHRDYQHNEAAWGPLVNFDHDNMAANIISSDRIKRLLAQDGVDYKLVLDVITQDRDGAPDFTAREFESQSPLFSFFTTLKNICDRGYLLSDRLHLTAPLDYDDAPHSHREGISRITKTLNSFASHLSLDLSAGINQPKLFSTKEDTVEALMQARNNHYREITFSPRSLYIQARLEKILVQEFKSYLDSDGKTGIDPYCFHELTETQVLERLSEKHGPIHDLTADVHTTAEIEFSAGNFSHADRFAHQLMSHSVPETPREKARYFPICIADTSDPLCDILTISRLPECSKESFFYVTTPTGNLKLKSFGSPGSKQTPKIFIYVTPRHLNESSNGMMSALGLDPDVLTANLLNCSASQQGVKIRYNPGFPPTNNRK